MITSQLELLMSPSPSGKHGQGPVKHSNHRQAVLVVENSKVQARMIAETLAKSGFDVFLVSDGVTALAACVARQFSVILMDYALPGMNGAQATEAIRTAEKPNGIHTPIIGYSTTDNSSRCLAAGMDDYLSKPAQAIDLSSRVSRWSSTGQVVEKPESVPTLGTISGADLEQTVNA